jgi:hypothetical protein
MYGGSGFVHVQRQDPLVKQNHKTLALVPFGGAPVRHRSQFIYFLSLKTIPHSRMLIRNTMVRYSAVVIVIRFVPGHSINSP